MSHHSQEDQERILEELNREIHGLNSVIGETGVFPDGHLNAEDEGEIAFAIGTTKDQRVVIHFGKALTWVGMTPEEARNLATILEFRAEQAEKGMTVALPEDI